jgi:hypothetical protein
MAHSFGTTAVALLVVACANGCASAPLVVAAPPAPLHESVPPQIIAPRAEGTPRELFARGEASLVAQRWQDAADSLEALLAAEPNSELAPAALLDLGMAYTGLERREDARDRYLELASRFPNDRNARTALSNACELHAYLEEWPRLVDTANLLLARTDIDDIDRMTSLGARGLGEIEQGKVDPAARDIENGLDIVERTHYGALNRLPVPAAQLRFALGELRRARSELVSLNPPGPDFLAKIDARCALLLSAQGAFADAIRSVDPHWAAMSGYRVGEMYRRLHHDLMEIPPVAAAKTEHQKQLHYGMMHVRYRVLLEKGLEMMNRTLALSEKTGDTSAWVARARDAKREMELALDEEKAQIAKLPFTEDELQRALDILQRKATAPEESAKPARRAAAPDAKAP